MIKGPCIEFKPTSYQSIQLWFSLLTQLLSWPTTGHHVLIAPLAGPLFLNKNCKGPCMAGNNKLLCLKTMLHSNLCSTSPQSLLSTNPLLIEFEGAM